MRSVLEWLWFVNRLGKPGKWIAADLYLEHLNYWVKVCSPHIDGNKHLPQFQRVFIASGNGVTVEYIINKGSAPVEAFRDISHLVANFFGDPDRERRSKEVKFQEDLQVLVEEMEQKKLHTVSATRRFIAATVKPLKAKKPKNPQPLKSAVFDVQVAGAEIWQNGSFSDFLHSTTYDPALGYPLGHLDVHDTQLNNGTVFDSETNPLVADSFEDLHGDEGDAIGLGGIGGGGEYSTGEILVG